MEEILLKNILRKKEPQLESLDNLKRFIQMYASAITNEKVIKENVSSYVAGINHIINATEKKFKK